MKKILFVNGFSGGSTFSIIKDLNEMFVDMGYETYFFGREKRDMNFFKKTFFSSYSKIGYFFNRLQTYFFGNDGFLFGFAKIRTRFVLNTIKPDIIHLHNVHSSFLNIKEIFKYSKKHNVKVYWTLHDCWLCTGRCAYNFECKKTGYKCSNCKFLSFYPSSINRHSKHYFLEKKKLIENNNIIFISPSNWLKNFFELIHGKKCIVINNGIDTKIFHSKTTEKMFDCENKIVVGCAAYLLTEGKGLNDIIELGKQLDSNKYLLVAVGRKITKPLTENNILFLPRLNSKEEMANFYNSISVFLNPTLQDNFPTTHLEALACGTPVITYDVGGAGELIRNGYNGFKLKIHDIKGIVDALNDDFDKKMSDFRKNVDSSLYSKETMKNRYKELMI
ncbi:MAG: glycosyltransferase [Candidatus Izemoplasmatales bacterium]|nr:glycosyltransferase [Candidatus Izemoplasmatales bacterium]